MRWQLFIVGCLCSVLVTAQIRQAQRETELNELQQLGWQIQSSSLSFDKNTIVFAAKSSGETNFNLYLSQRINLKWDKPTPLLSVNTGYDELWPSLSSDENQIYFVRRLPADPNDKKSEEQYSIFVTTRNGDNWESEEALVISTGNDIAPFILPDNQTLIFASKRAIEGRKDRPYALYYSRRIGKYNWYIPELITAPEEKGVNYYGAIVGGTTEEPSLRFTQQSCNKKDTTYSAEYMPLPDKYRSQPILTLSGSVKDADNQKYMPNSITVYNAITSQLITTLTNEGRFHIALPVGCKYLLDITADNYSHAYLEYDCSRLNRDSTDTQHLLLSKKLSIHVNVFDAEMQTPISQVQCKPQNYSKTSKYGIDMLLPIGETHTLSFSKKGYETRELTIDTRKEVLLTSSELDIDLIPAKTPLFVSLYDMDTKEGVHGVIQIENQNREEHLTYSDSTQLRQGDQYALNVTAKGYLYYDTIVSIPYSEGTQVYYIGLREIKQEMVLQLRNIHFEYNSASMFESSYEELDKIVRLLNENPALTIELAAHTDDIGTDAYNDKLSKRRGEAVMKYLIKHGIDASRVTSVGYGKRKPLVPNDSEENRLCRA